MNKRHATAMRATPTPPAAALTLAILDRAQRDAARGDLGALAWLVSEGRGMADMLTEGGGWAVVRWCERCARSLDAGTLRAAWRLQD